MGFADALDALGAPPSQANIAPASAPAPMGPNGVPRIMIYGKQPNEPVGSFGNALDILSTGTPQKSQPSDMGAGRAFVTGLKSGATANFSDELAGVTAAGRTLLPDVLNSDKPDSLASGKSMADPLGYALVTALGAGRLGYEALMGVGEGTRAYEAARDAEREHQRLASEQHPVANMAGNVTGALGTAAIPIGAVAEGAGLGTRALVGGVTGAGYGAAYGAGEGRGIEDRATRAASGAVVGGALGAAAPPVMAGASRAVGAVKDTTGRLLGHPIDTLRALRNPDEEAARRIGTAIVGDMSVGRSGMSASDLAAARSAGQPTSVIDVGGEGTRALARSAANVSPHAQSALEGMTQGRFNDQSNRVSDFVRNLVQTPANAVRTREAIEQAARLANKPAYAKAYAAGDKPIISAELERLTSSPDVVSAMREAVQKGKSRAIADGFGAFNPGVKITEDGQVLFKNGPSGVPAYPNLQFWDYTYRSLRDSASAAFRAGRNDEGSYLSSLSQQMRSELDKIVPEFGSARAGAAAFFGAENALEAGQKFVSMRGSLEEARRAIGKMTPAEKTLFAEGFVSDLADKISKIAENRSVTIDKIFNSPDGKARIALALGPGRAQELELFLRRENMMDLARKALGNSTTARQWQQMLLAGGLSSGFGAGAEAALTGNMDAKTLMTGALMGGAVAGHRAINFKLAQRIGEMLVSDDPKILRQALRMATNNPGVRNAMRGAESLIEKLAGQGASTLPPVLPMTAIGHANEQQQ